MKTLLYTFLPMALAATLVLVGGERMARKVQEDRTPINSDRFTHVAESFREETQRLEALYQGHLDNLSNLAVSQKKESTLSAMDELTGVRLIRIFRSQGKDVSIRPNLSTNIPEIELADRKQPLSPQTAFILPEKIFETDLGKSGEWLPKTKNEYRVYITRPFEDSLVTILVDTSETKTRELSHLTKWSEDFLIPIRGNNELLSITHADGSVIASSGEIPDNLPTAFVPVRNSLGQWNIQTWDRTSTSNHYDTSILSAATLFAIILLGAGFILFIQQKRALRLAASRVSFVNRVSHELGTPLTSIRLNLDLSQDALDHEPQITRRRLKLVSEEVDRLARLVTNVLTFARRERDTLEIKASICSPTDIINQTLKTFRPTLKRRGFEINSSISEIPLSLIDGDALAQITGNLISNVEKYASSGAWIKLTCTHSDELLTLDIQDRGPGIPISKKEQIFHPFERVRQDTSEGASGTGLGLSIARDLAEGMGGKLDLLSSNKGSHFQFQIPCPPSLRILQKGEPAA